MHEAWAALPEALRLSLGGEARRQGCRSVEHLLSLPAAVRWAPAVPLSEVSRTSLERAEKMKRALARMLAAPVLALWAVAVVLIVYGAPGAPVPMGRP